MGKSKKSKGAKQKEAIVTMRALCELSDEEELPSESEWDEKTKALKKVIETGRFDQAIRAAKTTDDDEFEEATLGDDSDDSEEEIGANEDERVAATAKHGDEEDGNDESEEETSEEESEEEEDSDNESDEENDEVQGDQLAAKQPLKADDDEEEGDGDEEDDVDDADEEDKEDNDEAEEDHDNEDEMAKAPSRPTPHQRNSFHAKALRVLTGELEAKTKSWPWAETFDIIPQEPLPFDKDVSIHDDLKREVTFYDTALKAVLQAKNNCKDANIPFSRPDDFFAEMVKSDAHMARVKDRLIFESKKMDAVTQRKSNKEQKLRAKESKAGKLAEKAKRKKDHFRAVEEWAETAKANRGQSLDDRENMDSFFQRKSKKREYADKKFGFGGRRGHFKKTDPQSLNDMSSYNPKGNFAGAGTKSSGKRKNGPGANRPGKRSRDAKRSAKR